MLPGRAQSPPHPEHPSSRGAAGAALVPQRRSRQLFPALCGRELPGDSSSLAASSPQCPVLFAASVSPPDSSEGCWTLWMDTQGCTAGGCTFRDAHLGVTLTQGYTPKGAHLGGCRSRDARLGGMHVERCTSGGTQTPPPRCQHPPGLLHQEHHGLILKTPPCPHAEGALLAPALPAAPPRGRARE